MPIILIIKIGNRFQNRVVDGVIDRFIFNFFCYTMSLLFTLCVFSFCICLFLCFKIVHPTTLNKVEGREKALCNNEDLVSLAINHLPVLMHGSRRAT
jgi:hypothetical protein